MVGWWGCGPLVSWLTSGPNMCVCSVRRIKPKACVQNKQNECSNVAGRPQAVTGVSLCHMRHAHMYTCICVYKYIPIFVDVCVCVAELSTDRQTETPRRTCVLHLYMVHACPTAATTSVGWEWLTHRYPGWYQWKKSGSIDDSTSSREAAWLRNSRRLSIFIDFGTNYLLSTSTRNYPFAHTFSMGITTTITKLWRKNFQK